MDKFVPPIRFKLIIMQNFGVLEAQYIYIYIKSSNLQKENILVLRD